MATPMLKYVAPSADEGDLNLKPEPVEIYGLPEGGGAASWDDITDKPAEFPPEAHTHAVADVTGLQAIIDDLTQRIEELEGAPI